MTYIGFSLSRCVQSIQAGEVLEENVEMIIANTRALNGEDWDEVLTNYSERFVWKKDPIECRAIAQRLIDEGKVIQPRFENKNYAGANWTWSAVVD